MAKQITCTCGFAFRADTDDELWEKAKAHLADAHPDLVDAVAREDILAQAELV